MLDAASAVAGRMSDDALSSMHACMSGLARGNGKYPTWLLFFLLFLIWSFVESQGFLWGLVVVEP